MAASARPKSPPTWQRLSLPRCITYPPHLRRTISTALIIGTILFVINRLNVVAVGHATTDIWIKVDLTYLARSVPPTSAYSSPLAAGPPS